MKRLRSMVFALVVAGLAVGTALPASAAANLPRLGDGLPEVAQEIGKLFSPEMMNALNLDSNQRNSFDELRRRGFGDRRDDGRDYREVRRDDRRYDRYDSRSLGRLYDVIDVGRRGYRGSYRFERDDDDGLEAFLAILSLGLMMSNRSPGYGYGYPDPYPYGYGYPDGYYYGGYGYDMIQLEDFLYLFYQILNLNQRQTFRVYFDRWYDDSYYYPRYHGRYDWDRYDGRDGRHKDWDRYDNKRYGDRDGRHNEWERFGFPRDMDKRLKLDDRQRKDFDRVFRDFDSRHRDGEKRYLEMERDYFKRSWDLPSQEREQQRKRLFDARKEFRIPDREIREKVTPILRDSQRKTFESFRKNTDGMKQWKPQNGSAPTFKRPARVNEH